jgi:branched-chain amino acid transport system ATP-binding protein
MPLLELSRLVAGYGGIVAVKGIDLSVGEGEIVTLIGSNGAGKSTALRAISALVRARAGTITFAGARIDRRKPHEVVALGISHVPEGRGIFTRLTVLENLQMGAYQKRTDQEGPGGPSNWLRRVLQSAVARDDGTDERLELTLSLFPRLKERIGQQAGTLSGGEQQMLAIGRALMGQPRLLLLDEPSMGLAPILVETIFATISEIRRQGATILLVEQNAALALEVADRGYVIESGTIVLEGSGPDLAGDDAVRRAYLGEG